MSDYKPEQGIYFIENDNPEKVIDIIRKLQNTHSNPDIVIYADSTLKNFQLAYKYGVSFFPKGDLHPKQSICDLLSPEEK